MSAPVAFEQAAAVLRQRDRAFLFIHGHTLDQSLVLEVSEIAGAVAPVTQIALRDDPERADGRERPRFRTIERVVAVAIAHELAVVTTRQIEIADEHVSRIEPAIIVPVASLTVTLAGLGVAAADLVVRVLDEPAATASEREVLIFAIVNAVISLSRIEITRIEIP